MIPAMRYRHPALALFLFIALTGLALLSIYLLQPPKAKPATAPATEFSAARAMAHVRQIAQEPHAMGTAAHAQVRAYLLQSMKELGLNPIVQQATVPNPLSAATSVGNVYNLVGRLKGSGNGKAILLVAHYDSQPNTLGAGDDGAGVAAILETIRALQAGEKLEHDVMVLLTDGEEYGLYGARAFMEHPWLQEVGFVINVEARGNQGPSLTFEMNTENGWVIQEYIKAAPYPYVSSLAYEIYSRMPNNTDFTIFKNAGFTGVNSAFMDGFVHYHKATDSPENLDQNSLQHHGSNMLALTRHFGNVSLQNTKAPDSVFFNFINGWVINYPKALNWLWFGLTVVALLVALFIGKRTNALTYGQVVAGLFIYLLIVAITIGVFIPVNAAVTGMLPYSHPFNGVHSSDGFFIAYILLALGLFLLLIWVAQKWLRLFSLMLGVCLVLFVLTTVLLIYVPAAAYLLMFPLLFVCLGLTVVFQLKLHQQEQVDLKYGLVLLLASVPAIFIMMPIVQVVFVAFALQMPMATIALFVLLLGLLLPLLLVLERSFSWRSMPLLPLVLLVVGVLQVFRAVEGETPTAERPLHSQVAYFLNTDTGKAIWATQFKTTDEWNSQFFTAPDAGPLSEIYPHARREYLLNEASALKLEAPLAELLQDSIGATERILQVRLHSPRGAAHMEIILQPQDTTQLKSIKLNDVTVKPEPIETTAGPVYYIKYHGLPVTKDGLLELRLSSGAPVKLLLYDQTLTLPQELVQKPKPAHVIAEQGDNSNITVVRKNYTF